jgi:hypothetical protein
MSSVKCHRCGLVQFPGNTCKGCGAVLHASQPAPVTPATTPLVVDGYAFPPPPSTTLHESGVWHKKRTLIMSKDATLPDRCVKCNLPAQGSRLKRSLQWHHPILYVLIFAGLIIYLIVALIARKKAVIYVGLCQEHLAKRQRDVAIAWGIGALSLLCFVLTIVLNDATFLLGTLVFLIAAIIYAIAVARVVAPVKIDNNFVWLAGVNRDYVNSFPEWVGP